MKLGPRVLRARARTNKSSTSWVVFGGKNSKENVCCWELKRSRIFIGSSPLVGCCSLTFYCMSLTTGGRRVKAQTCGQWHTRLCSGVEKSAHLPYASPRLLCSAAGSCILSYRRSHDP